MDLSIAIAAAFMVDKVGRRPLFLTAISGMVCSFGEICEQYGCHRRHNSVHSPR